MAYVLPKMPGSELPVNDNLLKQAQEEIEKGLKVCHCDKCGCMIETLNNVQEFLNAGNSVLPADFRERIETYQERLRPAESG